MASINISEDDFNAVAGAAINAKRAGHIKDATALDKVARKMNAALSNAKYAAARWVSGSSKTLTWKDVPSTIDDLSNV